MIKEFSLAGMTSLNTIKYALTPQTVITDLSKIKVKDGSTELALRSVTNMNNTAACGVITVEGELDISKTYTLSIDGYGEKNVVPTDIFDSDWFAENYNYDGNDLGAAVNGSTTTFKVWAPTASKVVLNLYKSGTQGESSPEDARREMVRGDKGVWSCTAECGHGTYYTYSVTTAMGTQEAVDPYAKAAGVNGERGMVVDLSLTDPEGWKRDGDFSTGIDSYSDAIIWEIHVRDFSGRMTSSKYKGKYLAFTETGLVNEHGEKVGIDYLTELGITHVHLLPVYDYATVDEAEPDGSFNWGYDPKNYNLPEGSYSTDPYHGEVRISEFKRMVMSLHNAGIGVIMDVAYNHTYERNSSLNKIVPYYYYRYTSTGASSNASGCGNDTASERYMFGKFIVDSVSYWLSEYHLDGFRFDLMGLHDLKTMQKVEAAVHTIDKTAIIYGEGWTMGFTVDGSEQADQANIKEIKATNNAIGTIAVFNDATRDGLKGSIFDAVSRGYISGDTGATRNKVIFGVEGGCGTDMGWQVRNAMVVNYMSSHDNNTLWDKLILSNGGDSVDTRMAMNRLGAAILMISKGTVFFQAGEEMLRTKPLGNGTYDQNSYMSDDSVNNICWSALKKGSNEYEMMQFYKGLISIRKAFDVFTASNATLTIDNLPYDGFTVSIDDGKGGRALAVINPHSESIGYTLVGDDWNMICNGASAGITAAGDYDGSVPAYSALIFVNDALINNR